MRPIVPRTGASCDRRTVHNVCSGPECHAPPQVPRPLLRDYHKWSANESKVLRFAARLRGPLLNHFDGERRCGQRAALSMQPPCCERGFWAPLLPAPACWCAAVCLCLCASQPLGCGVFCHHNQQCNLQLDT